MEKKTPHHSLERIKGLIRNGDHHITAAARATAYRDFGMGEDDVLRAVGASTPRDFYKSMTSRADARVWQDVYHVTIGGGRTAYVKLQIYDGSAIIISMKAR